jgi:hypothetical protein
MQAAKILSQQHIRSSDLSKILGDTIIFHIYNFLSIYFEFLKINSKINNKVLNFYT